jgi:hypothetical protein
VFTVPLEPPLFQNGGVARTVLPERLEAAPFNTEILVEFLSSLLGLRQLRGYDLPASIPLNNSIEIDVADREALPVLLDDVIL